MDILQARRLEEGDLEYRVEWYNNSTIYNQVYLDIPFSLSGTKEWFRKNLNNPGRVDFSFDFHGKDKGSRLVAMGGLVNIDLKHNKAERYFLLDPSFHKKGLGFKALNWICNYGFLILNLNRIYGVSIEGNEAILKMNEKEGWVSEGTLRKNIYYNGKYLDQHVKSILKCEWEKQSWKVDFIDFKIKING